MLSKQKNCAGLNFKGNSKIVKINTETVNSSGDLCPILNKSNAVDRLISDCNFPHCRRQLQSSFHVSFHQVNLQSAHKHSPRHIPTPCIRHTVSCQAYMYWYIVELYPEWLRSESLPGIYNDSQMQHRKINYISRTNRSPGISTADQTRHQHVPMMWHDRHWLDGQC